MTESDNDITLLLQRWRNGEAGAEDSLIQRVYPLLHRLAAQRLRRSETMTWQPTELVNEVYVKLFEQQRTSFQNRAHFLAIAARLMRRVVADHFRERHAQKRGAGTVLVNIDDVDTDVAAESTSIEVDFIELERLLDELAGIDARCAEIVELRYFAGLTVPETAEALSLSERTVKRAWQFARAWLHSRLMQPAPAAG